jgi:hypothetical protein
VITVTLQKNRVGIEEEIEIPHLQILSVDEIWDYLDNAEGKGKRLAYLGTLIGSRNHAGWLVKERAASVEKKIKAVANRCYNYECGDKCCGKDRLFPPQKKGKSA